MDINGGGANMPKQIVNLAFSKLQAAAACVPLHIPTEIQYHCVMYCTDLHCRFMVSHTFLKEELIHDSSRH